MTSGSEATQRLRLHKVSSFSLEGALESRIAMQQHSGEVGQLQRTGFPQRFFQEPPWQREDTHGLTLVGGGGIVVDLHEHLRRQIGAAVPAGNSVAIVANASAAEVGDVHRQCSSGDVWRRTAAAPGMSWRTSREWRARVFEYLREAAASFPAC